jgi:hypothetical protein
VPILLGDLFDLVEEHRFADAAKTEEYLRLGVPPRDCSLDSNSRILQYPVPTSQFGRLGTCAWREGIADFVQGSTFSMQF